MAFRILIAGLAVLLFQACAKIGSPTGGPQDVYPPEYISGTPENRSKNFSDDQIDINFNEYIQLKEQNKEILISPPMKEKPLVRVRERSIRVSFNEELLPNTTYTLNFGKSLTDLNEGNALPDFEFVVSTGDVIDSLSVTGSVVDAFTRLPKKDGNFLIMLYENLSDSAPFVEIPHYYGKANQFGLFAVNNIHPDTFRIIALEDGNNNLLYDPGVESIAFYDSVLVINPENVHQQTFIKDTLKIITPALERPRRGNKPDTANVADTLIAPGKVLNAVNISLMSFLEENNKVYITSRERKLPGQFTFVFNRPLFDSLEISPLNFMANKDWYLLEASQKKDTLTYWIADTTVAVKDTLLFKLSYLTTDSAGQFISRIDTVRLRKPVGAASSERGGGRRSRETKTTEEEKYVSLSANIANRGTLHLNADLVFTSASPIRLKNKDSMEFYRLVDTVFVNQPFDLKTDTISLRKFRIAGKWEEETKYKLILKPGSVIDLYGLVNDTLEFQFTTQKEDYYGNILLNFSSYVYPMIVQILNEKNAVVRSAVAFKAGIIPFHYMSPGRYSIKAIYDENGNGIWDTGNYLKHRQPEKIFISGKPEQLRSNWDWEPLWSITQ